ncbi:hypothetical protein BH20GEM2_BH20GEM2_02850 [soil metagenome]
MTRPAALLLLLFPAAAFAQKPPPGDGWNSPRAIELIRTAQARRAETAVDTGLVNYQAEARGHVYFYLDQGEGQERTLVKADQVALEVFWAAPASTKQRIVGLRDRKSLPTNIQYHLDHLSVVQDNFGDRIRLGDGDEVRDVLHPAAPGATAFYEYRLADSLTIGLPGAAEAVRVYELQVRPLDTGSPGFVGSVFVDRRGGDLVRMDFTFTPSSYLDRYLDYINVSLDNGLWKGRFWLPNQQRVEIRRAFPELDFPAGGIIRGTMRVSGYRFNQPLPPGLFEGPQVVAVPPDARRSFPFEQEIYAELRGGEGARDPDLEAIRTQAARLAGERLLSGLPALRADAPAASQLLRYDRAEGLYAGAGVTTRPSERLTASLRGGYAFGAGQPLLEGRGEYAAPFARLSAAEYLNLPRDMGGLGPAASGAVNTLSSLFAGDDYTDLFYARGVEVGAERRLLPAWRLAGAARWEEQLSASRGSDFSLFGDFRPVQRIARGNALDGTLELRREAPPEAMHEWASALRLDGGSFAPDSGATVEWLRPRADLRLTHHWGRRDAELTFRSQAGVALGTLPTQELFLIGGRGTLPGYPFRAFGGDRVLLGDLLFSADLRPPLLRGRLRGAFGVSALGDVGQDAASRWGVGDTDGLRTSVGFGVGIFYDLLRVDLMRGLAGGGEWELIVETRPSFWPFL